jgi:hypothetical protein
MSNPIFPHDEPRHLVEKLRRLADDIERIRAGQAPTAGELANAPILDGWIPATRQSMCLAGTVRGHPLLGDRRLVVTTEIYAIDTIRGWARTYSRFYVLGAKSEEGGSGHA